MKRQCTEYAIVWGIQQWGYGAACGHTAEKGETMTRKYKIGDRVWLFDRDHREYTTGNGCLSGEPIYEKQFLQYMVVGIEKRSYMLEYTTGGRRTVSFMVGEKAPWYSDSERDDKIWDRQYRPAIYDAIVNFATVSMLRKIKGILDDGGAK